MSHQQFALCNKVREKQREPFTIAGDVFVVASKCYGEEQPLASQSGDII